MDKFSGDGSQIIKDQRALRQGFPHSLLALAGLYQNRLAIDGAGGFQVTQAVADKP